MTGAIGGHLSIPQDLKKHKNEHMHGIGFGVSNIIGKES
jgi:hypothetical protein